VSRDQARSVVLALVMTGMPVSVRRRDSLWAACESDDGFEAQVREAGAFRDARQAREERDREEMAALFERARRRK
jgi:hypothetical protein